MSKYTPATALAIKRDVQRSQRTLGFLIQEIDEKREELKQIEAVLEKKRGLAGRIEDMVVGMFTNRMQKVKDLEQYQTTLTSTIQKLETAQELATAELQMRKEVAVTVPEGAVLLETSIKVLADKLDRLLSQIDASEEELAHIKSDIEDYEEAKEKAAKERKSQEAKVRELMAAVDTIDRERSQKLKELAREKSKLTEIQQRERDSKAMEYRLSSEYQKVYNTLPRRGKK